MRSRARAPTLTLPRSTGGGDKSVPSRESNATPPRYYLRPESAFGNRRHNRLDRLSPRRAPVKALPRVGNCTSDRCGNAWSEAIQSMKNAPSISSRSSAAPMMASALLAEHDGVPVRWRRRCRILGHPPHPRAARRFRSAAAGAAAGAALIPSLTRPRRASFAPLRPKPRPTTIPRIFSSKNAASKSPAWTSGGPATMIW